MKKYIDNQIAWLKSNMDAEIKSVRSAVDKVEGTNREAVSKVEATNNQKFEAQNEWRQQYKDQTSTFVTRRELWAAVLAILAIVVSAIALVLKK